MPCTKKDDIRRWFLRGKEMGATHLIVACDTFSYEDYPRFVQPGEDAQAIVTETEGQKMTAVHEVYRLADPIDEQIAARVCW